MDRAVSAARRKVQYHVTEGELSQAKVCREPTCAAQVLFHRLDNGRTMILDVASKVPDLAGGWQLEPHWGRCSNADRFRRTRPLP
jgi:hypothetical protein